MHLADNQCESVIFLICTRDDLKVLPHPPHILDFQTGEICVEYPRNDVMRVALALCGIKIG